MIRLSVVLVPVALILIWGSEFVAGEETLGGPKENPRSVYFTVGDNQNNVSSA